ncbi:MAG: phage head-tail connector protein [Proteobacteria bacterium]|nr:phage head-tail connector protein [Pseudomonadota bacterium]
MSSILLIAPAVEPLTLAEAKLNLRVEHADDDSLIAALITGARIHLERTTHRALITQSWRIVRESWPADGRLHVLPAPLRAVIAARVFDTAGVAHPIDAPAFVPDIAAAPGILGFAPWTLMPPGRATAGIEIDIETGYGAAPGDVPEPLRQAMRLLVAHWYENRSVVAGGYDPTRLPAGVAALIAPYRVHSL